MWKLIIEKIDNGYVLSWPEETEEGKIIIQKEVIEEKDDEKQTMTRLLHWVADYFGFHYNKFGKDNLNIKWNGKGSKL